MGELPQYDTAAAKSVRRAVVGVAAAMWFTTCVAFSTGSALAGANGAGTVGVVVGIVLAGVGLAGMIYARRARVGLLLAVVVALLCAVLSLGAGAQRKRVGQFVAGVAVIAMGIVIYAPWLGRGDAET